MRRSQEQQKLLAHRSSCRSGQTCRTPSANTPDEEESLWRCEKSTEGSSPVEPQAWQLAPETYENDSVTTVEYQPLSTELLASTSYQSSEGVSCSNYAYVSIAPAAAADETKPALKPASPEANSACTFFDNLTTTCDESCSEEMLVMASVDHPCCLRLLALCMTARPQLVTSFMPLGCLLNYLIRQRVPQQLRAPSDRTQATPASMLLWAEQIASGMAYLASRGIIHRDLAARNVLVESPTQVKITDFGLAKCLENVGSEYKAHGGRMPVKWLALESIRLRIFSSKSDVWSYGVTLWEVFTFGKRPFEHLSARSLLQHLESGQRLCQPPSTNLDLYALMVSCKFTEFTCISSES
ncbi:unnamed protein product [Dibothriocephalus latus]|uniref:Protein kinase domain-containing protein n=1 Tax=Dibothriocephalus latus TaxID=60516 RepID=A0A3P7KVS0_DIBLA|nr:unnamed protein product [Dibothriocephalus latus]